MKTLHFGTWEHRDGLVVTGPTTETMIPILGGILHLITDGDSYLDWGEKSPEDGTTHWMIQGLPDTADDWRRMRPVFEAVTKAVLNFRPLDRSRRMVDYFVETDNEEWSKDSHIFSLLEVMS